ncbi:MAG: sigma-70 family RNA polymerase sigma factor [Chloroflexota bacterium]
MILRRLSKTNSENSGNPADVGSPFSQSFATELIAELDEQLASGELAGEAVLAGSGTSAHGLGVQGTGWHESQSVSVDEDLDDDVEDAIDAGSKDAEINDAEINNAEINNDTASPVLNPAPNSESLLIERAKQDSNAFGELYERYVDRIYAYIYHRVGNAQDAEDLTARTFYRALNKLESYEDRGLPFSAWLFRIAHNLVANWHRDRSRRRLLSIDKLWWHSEDRDLPEDWVETEERHEALWEAINRLPNDRRDLLIYKFSSRLSNVEIGEMMGKSESAIKSLYFRTLAALRKDLESHGWIGYRGQE